MKIETITKEQLIAELNEFEDGAPILISVGDKSYPVSNIISGNGNIYIETPIQLGRPTKYQTDEERKEARREQNNRANKNRKKK